jgi:hypothetical protein
MNLFRPLTIGLLFFALPGFAQQSTTGVPLAPSIPAFAQTTSKQKQDSAYTAKIREFTTGPNFSTELVDHLPASDRVPTPEKTLGYIAGAQGRLTYTANVNKYMRQLAKTSKRVKVFSIGQSEEGREMIVVAVSDEANLNKLARYKDITARLADPRTLKDEDAQKLIKDGKAIYWATGAMHSTETGSPEMLMELAYRLAVEETPFIQSIRKNVIVLMTPVLETDGRDRVLDVINNRTKYPGLSPIYWGKYVAHDNNRDGMSLALALTRNVMKAFLEYHPTVLHDLHESVPFLYTSTGSGPYNPWLDPIVINEWHQLAYDEINEMTKRNVPGVWTHGFYDGWAPNYMFFIANGHNSIGRFYETFGNGGPDTQDRTVGAQSGRDWFRPNPPLSRVKWSLRNNVNYQQSALLLALNYTSAHKDELLHNFYLKGKRSIAKATTEGPAAYVLPADDKRKFQQAELIHLLRLHGIEVQQTTDGANVAGANFPSGSYVVRMDQPYSRMADMLLDTVYYNVNDPAPYDDTGWTLGPLKDVRTIRVTDPKILQTPMTLLKEDVNPLDNIQHPVTVDLKGPSFARIAILHTWTSTQNEGWWRIGFDQWRVPYDYISVHAIRDTEDLRSKWDAIVLPPGAVSSQSLINGVSGTKAIPWKKSAETPNLGSPDSSDDIRGGIGVSGIAHLKAFVDGGGVLVVGPGSVSAVMELGLVKGVTTMRSTGLMAQGSVLNAVITDTSSPITQGYDSTLAVYYSSGIVFKIEGEPEPVLTPPAATRGQGRQGAFIGRPSGRGGLNDPDVVQARPLGATKEDETSRLSAHFNPASIELPERVKGLPANSTGLRVLLRFAREKDLLVSGMLSGGEVLEGRAAVVDVPYGKGHVVIFSINPMWRSETQGSYPLVFNACLRLAQRSGSR